jgi:hypothetical protein
MAGIFSLNILPISILITVVTPRIGKRPNKQPMVTASESSGGVLPWFIKSINNSLNFFKGLAIYVLIIVSYAYKGIFAKRIQITLHG